MKQIYCLCILLSIFSSLRIQAAEVDKQYHLIGHRGGVTENRCHPENSLAALDEAVERGYTGVEIDIRESKDGVLFLYHYATLERDYTSKARCAYLTCEEIQQLKPLHKEGKAPVSVEEYCRYAQGKITELMLDIKLDHPSQAFYEELYRILKETGFINHSYFIGHGNFFLGKGKITMLISEREEFFQKYGEKTKDYYFLFAGIDELNSRLIRWCQEHGIQIMACVNRPYKHPVTQQGLEEALRDLEWLKSWGVTYYQIDSDYDRPFRSSTATSL